MSESQVIDLIENGDLVIKAGKDKSAVTVRVHSALLKIASPVFRAMLKSNFIEGSTLFNTAHPLLLPDDNGNVFLDLCMIVHHRPSRTQDIGFLPQLTVMADKYQCIEIVRTYIVSAVGCYFSPEIDHEPQLPKAICVEDVTCMAFVLRDPQLLWRASRSAILFRYADCFGDDFTRELLALLPERFTERLVELQKKMRSNLVAELACPETRPYARSTRFMACDSVSKALGRYRINLRKHDIATNSDAALEKAEIRLSSLWKTV